mmetsp:Transcript_86051/g.170826  ORF Transcript_86051/g.170826 Transcript_86051/m.170826 type:complete len:241 (+) Transcript_86051:419-1141(+)
MSAVISVGCTRSPAFEPFFGLPLAFGARANPSATALAVASSSSSSPFSSSSPSSSLDSVFLDSACGSASFPLPGTPTVLLASFERRARSRCWRLRFCCKWASLAAFSFLVFSSNSSIQLSSRVSIGTSATGSLGAWVAAAAASLRCCNFRNARCCEGSNAESAASETVAARAFALAWALPFSTKLLINSTGIVTRGGGLPPTAREPLLRRNGSKGKSCSLAPSWPSVSCLSTRGQGLVAA